MSLSIDPSFRGRLSSVLETEQGKALRNREKYVGERYKGGRRSVIETAATAPTRSLRSSRVEKGESDESKEQTTLEEKFQAASLESPLESVKGDRRGSGQSRHQSARISQRDVFSKKTRMAEFLRESRQTPELDEFEAQLAHESEGFTDEEPERVQVVDEEEGEVKAKIEVLSEAGSQTSSSEMDRTSKDIRKTRETDNISLSLSIGSATLKKPVRAKKRTGASLGSTLKHKMTRYVSGGAKEKYSSRRFYEEANQHIATSDNDIKRKHIVQSHYYFLKNPLEL